MNKPILSISSLLLAAFVSAPAWGLDFSKDSVLVRSRTDGEILLHNNSDKEVKIDSLSVRITSGEPGTGIAFYTRLLQGGGSENLNLIHLTPAGPDRLASSRESFAGIAIPARSSLRITSIWYGTCVYCLSIPGGVPYDHEVHVTFHATAARASDGFKLTGEYVFEGNLSITPDSVTVGRGHSSSVTVHNTSIAKAPIDSVSIKLLEGRVGDNFGFTTGTGLDLKYYVFHVQPVTSDSLAGGRFGFGSDTAAIVPPLGSLTLSQLRYGTCFGCVSGGPGMRGDYRIRVTLHSRKLGFSDSFLMVGYFATDAVMRRPGASALRPAGKAFRADGRRAAAEPREVVFESIISHAKNRSGP